MTHPRAAKATDGEAVEIADLYHSLRHRVASDSRWSQPISETFNQQYVPSDIPCAQIISGFAHEHEFEMCDMTSKLSKIVTMADLLKFYSTCSKLAMAKPRVLLFVLASVDVPHSLTVLEGLFALRGSLLAGNFRIFFRDRRNATSKEKQVMRTKVYNLCLWQADNILLLSNNDADEMRRKLNDLVCECSVCLEALTSLANGSVVYPFRCEHAFHSSCVKDCTTCPLCRNRWKPRRVVFRLSEDGIREKHADPDAHTDPPLRNGVTR